MPRPREKPDPTPLGKRLAYARNKRGLTQDELAELAGVLQSDISKLERGASKTTTSVVALAKALRIAPEWLQDGEGTEPLWATSAPGAPRSPPAGFRDRREVSPSDWATLEAVKEILSEAELAEIKRKHELFKEKVDEQVRRRIEASKDETRGSSLFGELDEGDQQDQPGQAGGKQ